MEKPGNEIVQMSEISQIIDEAFSEVRPPLGWEGFNTVDDFDRQLGDTYLTEYWKDVYDQDGAVTRFVLPFVMKYFVKNWRSSINAEVELELLIMQLTPSTQRDLGLESYYEQMYEVYSTEERGAICRWLTYFKENSGSSLISGIEKALAFWCTPHP